MFLDSKGNLLVFVIPTIISQLLAGKEEIKLGSLTPTRDFNYVKDTANGFIEIAKSKSKCLFCSTQDNIKYYNNYSICQSCLDDIIKKFSE